MGKDLQPKDIHVLMNELVSQATGVKQNTVVDASSFVSAGETVLATGIENTLNALSLIIGRTLIATRPYKAKLNLINTINNDIYSDRLRKISFYSKKALASGDYNTQLFTNLANGYTNGQNIPGDPKSTKSMWEQNQAIPFEMNFSGKDVWEYSLTRYEHQLQRAFRSESDFEDFISGMLTESSNDIESQREAFNRLAILQKIGQVYNDKNKAVGSVVNLTEEYNKEMGTTYTSAQLRSEHLESFLKFFIARFKTDSDYMTDRTSFYHNPFEKEINEEKYYILRHTPRDRQRLMLYTPLFKKAEAYVMPTIFNDEYLNINKQYEGVNYWQSRQEASKVDIIPSIIGNDGVQKQGDEVNIPYVVGMLFDEDSLMISHQLETSAVTPMEARKFYRNFWWTFSKNIISDSSENCIIYTMED